MQTRRIFLVALATLFLASCASVQISEKAARVQVHAQTSTLAAACTKLGPVSAMSDAFMDPYAAEAHARIKLREAAADLGADSVAVVSAEAAMPRVLMQGVAMRCY